MPTAHAALSPERPFIRGTAQNPDIYFQARETVNPFYAARAGGRPGARWTEFAERTGRRYGLVDYSGDPEAERVLIVMGSGGETARETVACLQARGERVGVAQVRLYRPFPARELPRGAARRRSDESRCWTGRRSRASLGEPLFLDVLAALAEAYAAGERELHAAVIGGRYGLSSKEFTPGMVAGRVRRTGPSSSPKRRFTIGINDDVSHTSLPYDSIARHRAAGNRARGVLRARVGRHRRREQEHDQDHRRRRGPARAGLFRVRLEEVRLADGLAPAVRPAVDPRPLPRVARRTSSGVTSSA